MFSNTKGHQRQEGETRGLVGVVVAVFVSPIARVDKFEIGIFRIFLVLVNGEGMLMEHSPYLTYPYILVPSPPPGKNSRSLQRRAQRAYNSCEFPSSSWRYLTNSRFGRFAPIIMQYTFSTHTTR